MRDRPADETLPANPIASTPVRGPGNNKMPTAAGDVIRPFLASGLFTQQIIDVDFPAFDTRFEGVQLLTSVYVPIGTTGFVKGIQCAPFMPYVFAPNWERKFTTPLDFATAPPQSVHGVWETPGGWEAYQAFGSPFQVTPFWRWHLTYVKGRIEEQRKFPLATFDLQSLRFVPELPVPRASYPQGIPGDKVGPDFSDQKVQRLDASPSLHLPVPENTSVCLWAEWKQDSTPLAYERYTALFPILQQFVRDDGPVLPLLPSYGVLSGYIQASSSPNTMHNAVQGWGG